MKEITVKPANSWDEHLKNLVTVQHWIRDTFWQLFIQKYKTTSSKQTRSFYARKEKKTIQCSNFPNANCLVSYVSLPDLSNQYIVIYHSEQFVVDVTPYFLRAAQFSFGLLCRALLVVINYLILKRKQHKFRTFGQISKLHSNQ